MHAAQLSGEIIGQISKNLAKTCGDCAELVQKLRRAHFVIVLPSGR